MTIGLGAVVTFIAFIGSDKLWAQFTKIGMAIPQAGIELAMNILVLGIVVLSVGSLIVPFGERAVEHRHAIRRLTEFIGVQGDRIRAAAELGSVKDRLGNVERIVTDQGFGVHGEIEALRDKRAALTDRQTEGRQTDRAGELQ